LQFAKADTQAKIAKEYVFANAINRTEKKAQTANKVYKSLGSKWLN